MEKTYNPNTQEKIIYALWEKHKVFSPEENKKYKKELLDKTYTVLMPPPNANAPLHCGHATYAIQDLMVRFKKMLGYDTLYLPGTDHAGFETQVVYERQLKKMGKSRFDYDRKTLYKNILDFVNQNSTLAINQLKSLGIGADWDKNTFMLEPKVIETVYNTFSKMYKDGLIYRDGYMVNYSPFHGTTFSELETEYIDSVSPLYYIKYFLVEDTLKYITIATVRPETIYADVAIAVNPKDTRFKSLVGKFVINPLTKKQMPIIQDTYVDTEFGTGALKITPGHDFNDFEIGKKNNLEIISVISLDGKMNNLAPDVEGMYPKPARLAVYELLKKSGNIEKVDNEYKNRVLVDYKDNKPIEPLIITNWFVDMKKLCEFAIKAVENEDIKFNKKAWKNEILRWLNAKKPWPISRQTVFGIKIPVWYSISDNPEIVVTFLDSKKVNITGKISDLISKYNIKDIRAGLQKVISPLGASFIVSAEELDNNYLPETDTFDTWFSSGQWPLTTTNYPNGELYKKYFPTDFLDSMWDIMFFWIARMLMFSLYLTNKVPFKYVYFHGAITDKSGKKMSKSRGNVIDPMDFVNKYGADALRMGIMVGGNTSARHIALDEDKVRGYRNFANKLWNIARYLNIKLAQESLTSFNIKKDELIPADVELLQNLNLLIKKVTLDLNKHKFKIAGDAIYDFIWNTLASDYLENTKNRSGTTHLKIIKLTLENCLKLLHPFMPFVTEALWQELPKSKSENSVLALATWPKEIKI